MSSEKLPRRDFMSKSAALAALSIYSWPQWLQGASTQLSPNPTIKEIVDAIVSIVPGGEITETVDTFKSGDPGQICSGIVSTFLATAEVIQKTADLGANLIITHEPTYYNHLDRTEWLQEDRVYQYKKSLIEKNGITVWRFHDYWHRVRPDGILQGLISLLGWEAHQNPQEPTIFNIPETTLGDLGLMFKKKMNLPRPFLVGAPKMTCSSVALLPGAWGGENQIGMWSKHEFDVMVVGEVAEWETSEYIRDATFAGMNRGLIILGHAVSEEPGMKYLVEWLKKLLDHIPVYHVPSGDAFRAV
ncbi:MAG: Nif3-like dinuclear metal center hexameric protein [Cyclobacteriaceae bacterium]|nr:Nif3-like dinuclear metal center hexameric protein [Cyclobacteriaceae bacterium]